MKNDREKTLGYVRRPTVPYGRGDAVSARSAHLSAADIEARVEDFMADGQEPRHYTHGATQSQYAAFRAMSKIVRENVDYKPETVDQHFPLPAYDAPERPKLVRHKTNWRKVAFRSLAFTLVAILAGGGFMAWRGYQAAGKVLAGTTTVAVLGGTEMQPHLLKGEGDGRVNVLLLGVGGEGHDGSDLTDTMMVASIDPINKTTTLISVPRDLWVKMPVNYFGQHQKINAAYSSGKYKYLGKTDASNENKDALKAGFAAADTVVSQVLGLRIDYNVLIDFKGFEKAIDVVGGVSVDVKEPLIDQSMAWENGNNATLASPGLQVMNGQRALLYARSRHTSSDFARSERQRQIIVALKDKLLSAGTITPMKIDELISTLGSSIYTDFSSEAALRLAGLAKDISDAQTTSLDMVSGDHKLLVTDRVGTSSIVRPKLGFEQYSDIQKFVAQHTRDGFLVREDAKVSVVGPTKENTAQELDVLGSLGYITNGTVIASDYQGSQAVLIDLKPGTAPFTKHYLENHYGAAKPASALPAGIIVPTGTQFVILVGT